jgi:hypothetical protein
LEATGRGMPESGTWGIALLEESTEAVRAAADIDARLAISAAKEALRQCGPEEGRLASLLGRLSKCRSALWPTPTWFRL